MKQRGKRIRPSGKDLVFHFTIASLLPVFLLVVGLFHVKTIQQINWQDFNLSQADKIDIPYLIISFSVAILICLLVAFVFKRVRYDTVKQLYHRQKLAKMILENKWYESEQVKTEGFFKDSAGRTKEKITYFPKMYYRLKNGLIQIRVEITLGKYQDQLLHLEKKLESGLYCELTDNLYANDMVCRVTLCSDDTWQLAPSFHDRGSISQILWDSCGFHMVYVYKNF